MLYHWIGGDEYARERQNGTTPSAWRGRVGQRIERRHDPLNSTKLFEAARHTPQSSNTPRVAAQRCVTQRQQTQKTDTNSLRTYNYGQTTIRLRGIIPCRS